jgi:hypothetical protein
MTDDHEARISKLEKQVTALTEALGAIVHGLEPSPIGGDAPFEVAAGQAARRAHDLLLSSRL